MHELDCVHVSTNLTACMLVHIHPKRFQTYRLLQKMKKGEVPHSTLAKLFPRTSHELEAGGARGAQRYASGRAV